jgi:hypothetical protein
MQKTAIIITIALIWSSCTSATAPKVSPEVSAIMESAEFKEEIKEMEDFEKSLGEEVIQIAFQVKAKPEEAKDFDNGIIDFISIEQPEVSQLLKPNEMVLPYNSVTLVIDYPLEHRAFFEITTTQQGFSRKELIEAISKRYHEVYEEESKTQTAPTESSPTVMNRGRSNGKYGIWGHSISDLVLDSVSIYKNNQGKISMILHISS